nr:transaldolase family protein [Nannocystis sp.]
MPAGIVSTDVAERVAALVASYPRDRSQRIAARSSPFWSGLTETGTELWLDTGDIDAAGQLWCDEFSALTTNNTLLNKEVQKGTYDAFISETARQLTDLDERQRVIEVAFVLNAVHALRLVDRFDSRVSVELHTAMADDVESAVFYGKRYFHLCPEHFIVKVPLTASGLIATRELRAAGVPVNFTLGFSARHNYLATAFARPSYVNVFLGRLGAYIADNKLGDGKLVGERTALASQAEIERAGANHDEPTLQIAASLRDAGQVRDLAGIDVFTMPTAVAAAAEKELDGRFDDRRETRYSTRFSDAFTEKAIRADSLWEISDEVEALVESLDESVPATAEGLVERAHASGCGDLFPNLSDADRERIRVDGKIPKHSAWSDRIADGGLAIDTLLNLAGLASFAQDQAALDDRIRRLTAG